MLFGTKWTGIITYSFPDSPADYSSGYSSRNEPNTGFSQAPAAEQFAIDYAVGLILGYTNASIQYAGTNSANIQIAQSSAANPTSYAYYPSTSVTGTGGDVWFGNAYDYTLAKLGNYYFATALHEFGHALGLKHSQELGGVANVAVPAAHDDSEFTIMSYRSYVGGPLTGYTNEAYGYPQTYMANDILALQTLYGANFSTHSENTTYSWNPNTGQEFINGVAQPAPGGLAGGSANRVFMTVWDGGGVDTYDMSNYTTPETINLNPGASSTMSATQIAYLGNGHYAQGNVFNAYLYNNDARSYIDNAVGGSGNDSITGNPIANYLDGGAGNDTIKGGAGNDVIIGGSGTDTAVFSGNRASYLVLYNSTTQTFTTVDQRAGSPDGTDTINGIENFQFADGVVGSAALAAAANNHAPVLTVADVSASPGQSLQVSSLISATDADNDALTYYFYDNTPAASSGHFVVNGTVKPAGVSFSVSAAQLAQTTFVAGADGSSDDVYVQVTDGYAVSSLREFHVNVHVNHAPSLTVADVSTKTGQSLQASNLVSATDADNDALTYYFYDNTPAADSGHFVVGGTAIAAGTSFAVSAAQLAQTSFVVGAEGTSDDVYVQVTDGYAVSSLGEFHINVAVNHAPVLTVADMSAGVGRSLQASSLFSATDADNDALTYYFNDNTPAANSGHFVVNGTEIAAGTSFGVSAAQLAQTVFVTGADGTSDDLFVQVTDGRAVSDLGEFHLNTVNHAPVLTVADVPANAGQSAPVSNLFSATDADNDTLTYYFYDNTPAANSGHFMVDGTVIPAGTSFGVSAAQLAQTVFVIGTAGTSDDLFVQVTDGWAVSDLGEFHVTAVTPVLAIETDPGEAPAEEPDTFPGMAGETAHFGASGNGGFVFSPAPAAVDQASDHINVSIPHLSQELAAAVGVPSDSAGAVLQAGLFGDAIASHVFHHLPADYFIV